MCDDLLLGLPEYEIAELTPTDGSLDDAVRKVQDGITTMLDTAMQLHLCRTRWKRLRFKSWKRRHW